MENKDIFKNFGRKLTSEELENFNKDNSLEGVWAKFGPEATQEEIEKYKEELEKAKTNKNN